MSTTPSRPSSSRLAGVIAGIVGIVLITVLLSKTESSPDTSAAEHSSTENVSPEPLPTQDAREGTADAEPAEAPPSPSLAAQEPKSRQDMRLMEVDLECAVDVTGPPIRAEVWLVSWPGSGRDDPSTYQLNHRPVRDRARIEDGVMNFSSGIMAIKTDGEAVRHTADLMVPGYGATRFEFITPDNNGPSTCVQSPIQLQPPEQLVVGTVRYADGSPATRARVEGCDSRARTDTDGSYSLVPRSFPCALIARHAPGTATQSPAQQIEAFDTTDLVVDFIVEEPATPDPGMTLSRDGSGIATIETLTFGLEQWAEVGIGAKLLMVGEIPTSALSDEEVLRAMVSLDQPIFVSNEFITVDGEVTETKLVIEAF